MVLPLLWEECDGDDDDDQRSHLKCVKTTKLLVVCNKVANKGKCFIWTNESGGVVEQTIEREIDRDGELKPKMLDYS